MTSKTASSAAMAPALPRKMAAGSRPERRRLSRAPSLASTANDRWRASRAQNKTATQNSPAAARASTPRSGSRAKANRISTSRANGATWFVATRDRSSMRRSLPAITAASRHTDDPRGRVGPDLTAGHGDDPGGEGPCPIELVGRQQHGGALLRRLSYQVVEALSAVGAEPGVGLVEEPQVGRPQQQGRDGHSPASARRQPGPLPAGQTTR